MLLDNLNLAKERKILIHHVDSSYNRKISGLEIGYVIN